MLERWNVKNKIFVLFIIIIYYLFTYYLYYIYFIILIQLQFVKFDVFKDTRAGNFILVDIEINS